MQSNITRAIFEAAADAILIIDQEGIIQALNASAVQSFGYDHENDLVGRNVSMLMPKPDSERHDTYLSAYVQTGVKRIIGVGRSVLGQRRDGSTFPIRLSVSEFDYGGRRLFAGICHDDSARVEFIDRLAWIATHDELTRALNRHGIHDEIARRIGAGEPLAVIYLDLDGFRQINENHGRRIGDQLLVHSLARVVGALGHDDAVARVEGDEFVVVLKTETGSDRAEQVAQQLLAEISRPFYLDERAVRVTASLGISSYPADSDNVADLLNFADMAMTEAQRVPGNAIYTFDRSIQEQNEAEYRLTTRIRDALDENHLVLHYQSQFSLTTGEPVGMEALVRWIDPSTGLVPPDEFLPVAQEHGLMPLISEWVLRRACRDNAQLIASGVADIPVAVNIDAPFFSDPSFVPLVRAILEETGLSASRLEIEVVEGVALTPSPQLTQNIADLHELGVTLAMDDFGTGYSSMLQLASLKFDRIKLDRGFIGPLPSSKRNQAVVTAMVNIAGEFEIAAIAEGIETEEQRDFLREIGCLDGQGFLFAHPQPLEDLPASLTRRDLGAEVRRMRPHDQPPGL